MFKTHQKIKLLKDGDDQTLYYENNNHIMQKKISTDEYDKILKFIQPNFSFSLPDRLIQDLVKDGQIFPSFKNSMVFTNNDFKEMIEPLDRSILEINKKRKKKYLKNFTKKNNKKKEKKIEILNKITKKKKKNTKKKQNKKKKKN